MAKNIIKLTESELEGLVKKIMSEEKRTPSNKVKSSKSLNEGKEFLRKFHNKKKSLVKEGYSKKEVNEQLTDFLGMSDDSPLSDVGFGSAKQWMISWILGQLNISGELNQVLSIALSKIEPKDYTKLFDPVDNCEFISDVVFDTFLQYASSKIIMSLGGKMVGSQSGAASSFISSDIFSIVLGNAVMRMFKNNDFKRSLQKMFTQALCDALAGRGGESELYTELGSSNLPKDFVKDIKANL